MKIENREICSKYNIFLYEKALMYKYNWQWTYIKENIKLYLKTKRETIYEAKSCCSQIINKSIRL